MIQKFPGNILYPWSHDEMLLCLSTSSAALALASGTARTAPGGLLQHAIELRDAGFTVIPDAGLSAEPNLDFLRSGTAKYHPCKPMQQTKSQDSPRCRFTPSATAQKPWQKPP